MNTDVTTWPDVAETALVLLFFAFLAWLVFKD